VQLVVKGWLMPQRQRSIRERIGPDTTWLGAQVLLLSVAALAGRCRLPVAARSTSQRV
jgi:hypothetical protein